MRYVGRIVLLLGLPILVLCGYLHAQNVPHGYSCTMTSVSGASTPVAIMTPGQVTTWSIENSSTPGNDPVLVAPYTGASVPTAMASPEADMEIPSGTFWQDAISCSDPSCKEAMGQGWMAVLESGSTATKVRVCAR